MMIDANALMPTSLNQYYAVKLINSSHVALCEATENIGNMAFTSDVAMVAAIGEALQSGSTTSPVTDVKKASLESLAASYQAWIESEISASPLASLDVDPAKLGDTILKQLTFVRICEDWDNLCSCGEKKTLELLNMAIVFTTRLPCRSFCLCRFIDMMSISLHHAVFSSQSSQCSPVCACVCVCVIVGGAVRVHVLHMYDVSQFGWPFYP